MTTKTPHDQLLEVLAELPPGTFTHRHRRFGSLCRIEKQDGERVTFSANQNVLTVWASDFENDWEPINATDD